MARSTRLAIALTLSILALPAAGQERWRPVGPPAPVVPLTLVLDPFSPTTLYVTDLGGDGSSGVWRSTDSGRHWRSINAGLETPYVLALTADPFHPGTLFAAVNHSSWMSLRRSDDRGNTWREIYVTPPGSGFDDIVADPVSPGTLWSRSSNSLGRSDDHGATWASVGSVGYGGVPMDFVIDPLDAQTVYFPDTYVLWKSTDRGVTWSALSEYEGRGFDWVVPAPVPPAVLYARPTTWTIKPPPHCVRSDDGGLTWTPIPLGNPQDVCFTLMVDPQDSLHAWAVAGLQQRLYVTHDGGETWPEVHEGVPDYSFLRREPSTGTLYVAGEGIFRSDDGGETWEAANHGMQSATVQALLVVPGDPGREPVILAQPKWRRLARSGDGGRTWRDLPFTWVSALAADPADPSHLFAATGGLRESRDSGRTWTVAGALPTLATHIAVSPGNPRVLYLGVSGGGVFRSHSGGRSWQKASAGLPVDPECDRTFCYPSLIDDLSIDPVDPRILLLTLNGKLYRTTDAGRHWQAVQGLEPGVRNLARDPRRSRVLYAAGDRLFRSRDGGATWREVGPFPGATKLLVDSRGDDALYAASATAGVLRSLDGGLTWEPLLEGLPMLDVRLLALDPAAPGLFAAVGGAGIWALRF